MGKALAPYKFKMIKKTEVSWPTVAHGTWESPRATRFREQKFYNKIMITELILMARNVVLKTYRASGRYLAPHFVQVEFNRGVH